MPLTPYVMLFYCFFLAVVYTYKYSEVSVVSQCPLLTKKSYQLYCCVCTLKFTQHLDQVERDKPMHVGLKHTPTHCICDQ